MAGKGGKREGAGRPPSLATRLKREHLNKQHTRAINALDHVEEIMLSATTKDADKLEAAKIIMDRVWGKPKQTLLHGVPDEDSGGTAGGAFVIAFERRTKGDA